MEADPSPIGDSRPAEEAALLSGLQQRDEAAFERLVATYGPRLRATALRLMQNEADAHDVVQETFLNAIRGLQSYKGEAQLGTWLHRIAVNCALMKLRSRKRRPEVDIHDLLPRFTDGGTHLEPIVVLRVLPEQEAARHESAGIVRQCINQLPADYRTAVILKDIEELDYEAIADQLGLTLSATRVRIHRARQALRKLLAPHFGERSG